MSKLELEKQQEEINKFKVSYKHCFQFYNNTLQDDSIGYKSLYKIVDDLIDDIDTSIFWREEYFSQEQKEETIRTKVFFEKLKQKATSKLIELDLKLQSVKTIDKKVKPKKTINDFILNVNDEESFLRDLNDTFKTEIGQKIRALIEKLKAEKILMIGESEFRNFYEEFKIKMNGNIGSYQSINDLDKDDWEKHYEMILEKLKPLILKYKSND